MGAGIGGLEAGGFAGAGTPMGGLAGGWVSWAAVPEMKTEAQKRPSAERRPLRRRLCFAEGAIGSKGLRLGEEGLGDRKRGGGGLAEV